MDSPTIQYTVQLGKKYINGGQKNLTTEQRVRFLLEEGNWTLEELKPWGPLYEAAYRLHFIPPADSINRHEH